MGTGNIPNPEVHMGTNSSHGTERQVRGTYLRRQAKMDRRDNIFRMIRRGNNTNGKMDRKPHYSLCSYNNDAWINISNEELVQFGLVPTRGLVCTWNQLFCFRRSHREGSTVIVKLGF
jgi:hypothetical protein